MGRVQRTFSTQKWKDMQGMPNHQVLAGYPQVLKQRGCEDKWKEHTTELSDHIETGKSCIWQKVSPEVCKVLFPTISRRQYSHCAVRFISHFTLMTVPDNLIWTNQTMSTITKDQRPTWQLGQPITSQQPIATPWIMMDSWAIPPPVSDSTPPHKPPPHKTPLPPTTSAATSTQATITPATSTTITVCMPSTDTSILTFDPSLVIHFWGNSNTLPPDSW